MATSINNISVIAIEDLIAGRNDWCNIPEILRATCRVFYDTLVQQQQNMSELAQKKANKDSIGSALHRKANRIDVDARIGSLELKVHCH